MQEESTYLYVMIQPFVRNSTYLLMFLAKLYFPLMSVPKLGPETNGLSESSPLAAGDEFLRSATTMGICHLKHPLI